MATVAARPITAEEFLAIEAAAGDDVTLELINGEIREYPNPKTPRAPLNATTIARSSHILANWLDDHLTRDGEVAAGEVRCRISRDPESIVGIDVAYFEGTPVVELQDGAKYYDGPPVIAVEILSPSDEHEHVTNRIRTLLDAGVKQAWVADPDFRTITVHRADADPRLYAAGATLEAAPELPGLSCRVERLFGRPQQR